LERSDAVTGAFVALAAKMAKADGVAVAAEWQALERFLEIPDGERERVHRLYEQAKSDTGGAEALAEHVAQGFAGDADGPRQVLECLLYVACSDGVMHPAEDAFLTSVATALGIGEGEYRHLRALFVHDAEDPHVVLGVPHGASPAEIRARYRQEAARLHPDRLIAVGASPAVIKAATAELAALNVAYETLVERSRTEARG
jgi:DnaJ like chaperone protein